MHIACWEDGIEQEQFQDNGDYEELGGRPIHSPWRGYLLVVLVDWRTLLFKQWPVLRNLSSRKWMHRHVWPWLQSCLVLVGHVQYLVLPARLLRPWCLLQQELEFVRLPSTHWFFMLTLWLLQWCQCVTSIYIGAGCNYCILVLICIFA